MQRPELIHRVNPALPEGRQPLGVILIESIIDRHGRVCAARLQRGSEPLATAFLEAVKEWRFKPATRNGKAVAVFYYLTVNFDGG
jgi:TonB family protein